MANTVEAVEWLIQGQRGMPRLRRWNTGGRHPAAVDRHGRLILASRFRTGDRVMIHSSPLERDMLEQLSRLEWYGGLYLYEGQPCLPGEVLEAALTQGAKRTKRGRQAQAGIVCRANYPLIYEGPTDLEALWQDPAFRLTVGIRMQRNRVMRTRPCFPKWACEFELQYSSNLLHASQIRDIVQRVGREIGIGDWRPRFGRFEVES